MLRWIDGSPQSVVARLRGYSDAGVDRVMLQQLWHEDIDSVAMLGREVLPALGG
jgi:hypothetical protein